MTKENSSIKLKAVEDLFEKSFFIPDYQRGYRWEKKQVKALLEDIHAFATKENEKFYCLQPLIVKQKEGREWEVIDGQQRLTTIFLILKYLDERELYSITYQTRECSKKFLEKIEDTTKEEAEENIDFYHIFRAYQTIKDFFKKPSAKEDFKSTLKEKTKFIWYEEQSSESSKKAFRNFNSGKIPLTKAELIRGALALGFSEKEQSSRALNNKISFAVEWHDMEQLLANDRFWYFLHHKDLSEAQRMNSFIEAALEAEGGKNGEDELEDYRKGAPERWAALKKRFEQWREFYEDSQLYHLTGFLVATNKRNYGSKVFGYYNDITDKASLKDKLMEEIRGGLQVPVEHDFDDAKVTDIEKLALLKNLSYGNHNRLIKKILLLHNVLSYQERKDEYRFPFKRYKKESWDIEHIQATASHVLDNIENIVNNKNEFSKEEAEVKIDSILSVLKKTLDLPEENQSDDDRPTWDSIKKEINDAIKEKKPNEDQLVFSDDIRIKTEESERLKPNCIWNLALLDQSTNRGIKSIPFSEKRKHVLKNEENKLILICTEKVFNKSYPVSSEELSFWEEKDREAYLKNMSATVSNYITIKKEQ